MLMMRGLLTDGVELRLGRNAGPRTSRGGLHSRSDLPWATEGRDEQAQFEAKGGDL
jgi:hypothetical protein